jgi:hypothetical protein
MDTWKENFVSKVHHNILMEKSHRCFCFYLSIVW